MSKINGWERVKQSQKPRKIHRCVTGTLQKKERDREIVPKKIKLGEKVSEKNSKGIKRDWGRN